MNESDPRTTRDLLDQFSGEPNYGAQDEPDFEPLSRDRVHVRSLEASDLEPITRIDRKITGHDRRPYLERKLAEALDESGIRVSLVAEEDDRVVGYVMARVDYGDFGQTDTTALVDTIGVDPEAAGAHVGTALVSQLLANLSALRVETVRTEVDWRSLGLIRFLARCGFAPSQRLSLARTLG